MDPVSRLVELWIEGGLDRESLFEQRWILAYTMGDVCPSS